MKMLVWLKFQKKKLAFHAINILYWIKPNYFGWTIKLLSFLTKLFHVRFFNIQQFCCCYRVSMFQCCNNATLMLILIICLFSSGLWNVYKFQNLIFRTHPDNTTCFIDKKHIDLLQRQADYNAMKNKTALGLKSFFANGERSTHVKKNKNLELTT